MLRVDLKNAGIAYIDKESRLSDFHSLRYTTASLLAASGVSPKVVQTIMRQSDINLTMQIYTHVYSEAPTKAISSLPDLSLPASSEKLVKTGTDTEVSDAIDPLTTGEKKTEKCLASCLSSECGKRRIFANQDELKTHVISENRITPETSITAIKRSYRPDETSAQGVSDTLEARGFEPLSRDISGRSSTCVVVILGFAQRHAQRQACRIAISQRISPWRCEKTPKLSR